MANLGRKGLVTSNVKICPASDLVRLYNVPRFHIAQHPDVRHSAKSAVMNLAMVKKSGVVDHGLAGPRIYNTIKKLLGDFRRFS